MTDEKHAFIQDVIERGTTVRQSGTRHRKAGKSSACDLPHDHLTPNQILALHGDTVTINLKKPIEYAQFMKLSDDIQKEYLHGLLDTYGGNAERIGAMWSIPASKVKFFFVKFNMEVPYNNRYKKSTWETFLTSEADDNSETEPVANALVFSEGIPHEPISRAEFDALSHELKKDYIFFLKDEQHFTNAQIASMWNCSSSRISQLTRETGWKRTFMNTHVMATTYEFQKWLLDNGFDIDLGHPNEKESESHTINAKAIQMEDEPSKDLPIQEELKEDVSKVSLTAIDGVEIGGNLEDILRFLKPILGTGEWRFTISARKD